MARKATAILRDLDAIEARKDRLPPNVYLNAKAELEFELVEAYGRPAQAQAALDLGASPQTPETGPKSAAKRA